MRTAIAACLCFSSLTYADCEIGTPLLDALNEADSANNTARDAYIQADKEATQAYNTWQGWIGTLDTFKDRRDDAERDWIIHWLACEHCEPDAPGCNEGDNLEGYYRLMCFYVDQTYQFEGEAYEEYCQKWQARGEAQTEWNETEMSLELAHVAYWTHVNGPPPCSDCN